MREVHPRAHNECRWRKGQRIARSHSNRVLPGNDDSIVKWSEECTETRPIWSMIQIRIFDKPFGRSQFECSGERARVWNVLKFIHLCWNMNSSDCISIEKHAIHFWNALYFIVGEQSTVRIARLHRERSEFGARTRTLHIGPRSFDNRRELCDVMAFTIIARKQLLWSDKCASCVVHPSRGCPMCACAVLHDHTLHANKM